MKNKIIIIASLIIVFTSCFTKLQSQVTIGTMSAPLKGTILDLKQKVETNGKQNSEYGMMYPRVALNSPSVLLPDADATNPLQYTGLTVYNITKSASLNPGLYVWDGTKWNPIKTELNVINGLSQSNDSILLGESLDRNTVVDLEGKNLTFSNTGKIGIGKANPAAKLDVLGSVKVSSTMSVGDTLTANGSVFLPALTIPLEQTVSQIGIDRTGQVYKIGTANNTYPLTYIKYVLTAIPRRSLLTINDYDTQIPWDKYTLIIVGSALQSQSNITTGLKMMPGASGFFAVESVFAFRSGSTWHLKADYPGGMMADTRPGIWTLYCVAINNSIIKNIQDQNVSIYGNSTTGARGEGVNPL
jgi:hypothetical protein